MRPDPISEEARRQYYELELTQAQYRERLQKAELQRLAKAARTNAPGLRARVLVTIGDLLIIGRRWLKIQDQRRHSR